MITNYDIQLALPGDAHFIAEMSRDFVEDGLGWRWTPDRVLRCIHDPTINVAVANESGRLLGYSIMEYKEDEAHLLLLAVQDTHRRRGIGSALVSWLETTALTAGIGLIYLEARTKNEAARTFYRSLGYQEIKMVRGYYRGREDAIRIAKDLWL